VGVDFIYSLIGQRIRAAREELNLSQAELATKLRVSTPAITHYENATRRIPLYHLKQLGSILGKPHSYFVDDFQIMVKPSGGIKLLQ